MDGKLLQGVLGTHLIESAELHYDVEHAEHWWFLQDNDPKHKSNIVRTWLFNHGIQPIDFPPYSPDLNPIENLWALLKKIYERYPDLLEADDSNETKERLINEAQEVWADLAEDILATLSDTMPNRVDSVIDAKGWYTKY